MSGSSAGGDKITVVCFILFRVFGRFVVIVVFVRFNTSLSPAEEPDSFVIFYIYFCVFYLLSYLVAPCRRT